MEAGTDAKAHMSLLYDYYGGLLSDQRSKVFSLYHEEDLSLAEIAELLGISRQGVHGALKRAEAQLEKFEDKLGLIARHEAWLDAVGEISPMVRSKIEEIVDI
jgi:predicted DNA-binding protein YlxM (UPF0122 family)